MSGSSLVALHASDGSPRWRVQESQEGAGVLQPAVADGGVYVADSGGISAFNASNGAKRWPADLPASEIGPAAPNGMVYVGAVADTGAPTIAALSASDG